MKTLLVLEIIVLAAMAAMALRLRIEYRLDAALEGGGHSIRISLLGIPLWQRELPLIPPRNPNAKKHSIWYYRDVGRVALEYARAEQFGIRAIVGLDDAFGTAMACGAAETLSRVAMHQVLPYNQLFLTQYIQIVPAFDRECLELAIHCIFTLNLANSIGVLLYALRSE